MKPRLHQFLLLLLAFMVLPSDAQEVLWEKSYGGLHADYLMDAIPTADYGFLIIGSSISGKTGNKTEEGKGGYDYWLWKIDEQGEVDWQKSFGGAGNDLLYSVKTTRDGGYILAGISNSEKGIDKKDECIGQNDIWIIKLNAMGEEVWQRTIGGIADEQITNIIQTKDNGFLICASSESDRVYDKNSNNNIIYKSEDSFGGMDFWVIKLSEKGELKWQKTIGGDFQDQTRTAIQTIDGGFVIAGVTNSQNNNLKISPNNGAYDVWYLKLNLNGEVLWQNIYGAEGDENIYTILQRNDGKLLIAGNTNSKQTPLGNTSNGSDFFILNVASEGTIINENLYNVGKYDILTNLIQNKDETLLLCGYVKNEIDKKSNFDRKNSKLSKTAGLEDYFVIKLDKEGTRIWDKAIGTEGTDILAKAIETRDGGYILAGTSQNNFWVVKLKDSQKQIIEKKAIEAFPNPTSQFTNVIIGYEFETAITTITDLSGKILQQFQVTNRTIPIDLGNYPKGIYIVNITTKDHTDGLKIIKK